MYLHLYETIWFYFMDMMSGDEPEHPH